METEHIHEFLTLAKTLNYSRAAEACHLSQSALSRHIQSIEAELGVALFVRTKSSVALTKAGEIAVEEFTVIENRHASLLSKLASLADNFEGVLNLGMLYYGAGSRYGYTLVERFRRKNPQVKLVLTSGQPHKIAADLAACKIDAGVTLCSPFAQEQGIEHIVLGREPLYAIVPNEHPWALLSAVKPEAFAGATLLLQEEEPTHAAHVLGLLRSCGVKPHDVVHTPNIDTLMMTLNGSNAVFVGTKLLEALGPADLAFVPIAADGFELAFSLAYRTGDENEFLARLIECA